jgi:hypothetical protein
MAPIAGYAGLVGISSTRARPPTQGNHGFEIADISRGGRSPHSRRFVINGLQIVGTVRKILRTMIAMEGPMSAEYYGMYSVGRLIIPRPRYPSRWMFDRCSSDREPIGCCAANKWAFQAAIHFNWRSFGIVFFVAFPVVILAAIFPRATLIDRIEDDAGDALMSRHTLY